MFFYIKPVDSFRFWIFMWKSFKVNVWMLPIDVDDNIFTLIERNRRKSYMKFDGTVWNKRDYGASLYCERNLREIRVDTRDVWKKF